MRFVDLGSDCRGTVTSLAEPDEVMRRVPEVFGVHLAAAVGQEVFPFVHGGNLVACVLFDCPRTCDYTTLCHMIRTALDLRIGEC